MRYASRRSRGRWRRERPGRRQLGRADGRETSKHRWSKKKSPETYVPWARDAGPFPVKFTGIGPENAATFEKESEPCVRMARKYGTGSEQSGPVQSPKELCPMKSGFSLWDCQLKTRRCCGSETGMARSMTLSMMVKMAVLAPMPRARVSTTTVAKR